MELMDDDDDVIAEGASHNAPIHLKHQSLPDAKHTLTPIEREREDTAHEREHAADEGDRGEGAVVVRAAAHEDLQACSDGCDADDYGQDRK